MMLNHHPKPSSVYLALASRNAHLNAGHITSSSKAQIKSESLTSIRSAHAQSLWRDLQMNNRPITIYKGLVDRLGCVKAALLLSQLIYWTRKGVNVERDEGWFFKTVEEMMFETGLSRKEQLTAKRKLKSLDLLEFKMAGVPALPFYRLNLRGLTKFIVQTFEINAKSESLSLADIRSVHGVFEQFLAHRLPYHTILANIAGGINAGLMLSFLFQNLFKGYSQKVQGFVTKSIDQWQSQTGLTYKEQRKARERLIELGFISEHHFSLSRDIYTRIEFGACFSAFEQISVMRTQYVNTKMDEKRASLELKKGFSSRTEKSNTGVPKGEIQSYRKGKYSCTDTSNTAVPKGEIQIYKTTKTNTTDIQEYIQKPQQRTINQTLDVEVVIENNVMVGLNDLSTPLFWPNCLSDEQDRTVVLTYVRQCKRDINVQLILDEMLGIEYAGKPIHSPIRYFGKLLSLYLMNQFVPELAHKVRKRRESLELRKSNDAKQMDKPRVLVKGEEWQRRMNLVRQSLKNGGTNRVL